MKFLNIWSLPIVVTCLMICAGCGGYHNDGPQRFKLSGAVTYKGSPVPVGEISFMPDTIQGNSGPGAVAFIKNGQYATRPHKGVTPGPMIVVIKGYNGVGNSENADGAQLFSPFQTHIDLEPQDSIQDFVVESSSK